MESNVIFSEIAKSFLFLEQKGFISHKENDSLHYYYGRKRISFYYYSYGNELEAEYVCKNLYKKEEYNLFFLLSLIDANNDNQPFILTTSEAYLKEKLGYYSIILENKMDSLLNNKSSEFQQIQLKYKQYWAMVGDNVNDKQNSIEIANYIKAKDYEKALFYLNKKIKKTDNDYKREIILRKKIKR